jgi:hypothetical protein
MHPIVLTYINCLFMHHNTTILQNRSHKLCTMNGFIDFNGILLLHVSGHEKLSSGKYTLITYS